jgi:ADP-heptose:LPS heptosyltransferase
MEQIQIKPKILVIRHGAMGDVIMTTPIIRELYKRHNGQCEIYVATDYPDVYLNNPYVAQVNPQHKIEFSGIYNLDLAYESNPRIHAVHAYRRWVFGVNELSDYSLELFPTEADHKRIESLKYGNFIVIHMRHFTWPSRNLKVEFYQDLITKILTDTDLNIVQIGKVGEISFSGSDRLINDLGKYSLHEVKCLIEKAKAFICTDGGLLHVGATTDTPMLAFFTSCKADYRKPLKPSAKFIPIEANIPCYGCQESNPAPCTQFVCSRHDVACVDTFCSDQIVAQLKTVI